MKQIAILLMTVLSMSTMAQSEGKIIYTETIKIDIQIEGMDKEMLKMIPKSQSFDKELLFKNGESLYQDQKDAVTEDLSMESDDGAIKIVFLSDEVDEVLYKNMKEKTVVHKKGMMGKAFLIKDKLKKYAWKLTGEKIKYLEYECQKAVIETADDFIVAWFTTQIPGQFGPAKYHGLPGVILMMSINEGEIEIKAQSVDLSTVDKESISAPNEGKKVTYDEFDKIEEEKVKEMEEMHEGRRMNGGR